MPRPVHAPAGPAAHAPPGAAPHAARPHPIPPFTEEHEQFRETVRRFVESELLPHAQEWEEARWFPSEVFGRLAELGYIGLKFPEEYGGDGDPVADAVFVEELARCGSGGVSAGIGAHSGIALPPIWRFGSEEQKQRYLVPAIRGEKIAALAITEPDAGSDVAGIRTYARRVDGGYVVNGSKTFITGGVRADILVTAVKTTQEGGHRGLSFLIVEKGPGVEASALEKLGWHASDTALIGFDDVFVPEENLLGEENQGFYLIMANFQWERLLMALGSVGGMQSAFEKTLQLRAGAARLRPRDRAFPGHPAQAGRDRGDDRGRARRHLRGAAPLRGRRGRHARGDDRQARHPAGGVRGDGHLPADPWRQRLHGRVRDRARRARRAARADRRRDRRDHEGDPGAVPGALAG